MASSIRDKVARQLYMPTKGVWGTVTYFMLRRKNDALEKNAARLCAIEPHHKVLEIGFGPGTGVKHALQYVKDGPGKICGVDLSPYMVEKASARLRTPIRKGQVELGLGNVMHLPYSTNNFDRIFHCNCYYFWPSMQDSLQEIHRVMKPGGMMVTVLNLQSLQRTQARGLLKYGNPDPLKYMCALELSGFKDVRIEYFKERSVNYQAIFAHLPVEPETEYALLDHEVQKLHGHSNDVLTDLNQEKGVHTSHQDSSSLAR